jgi:hypothetical protein
MPNNIPSIIKDEDNANLMKEVLEDEIEKVI